MKVNEEHSSWTWIDYYIELFLKTVLEKKASEPLWNTVVLAVPGGLGGIVVDRNET